MLASSQELQLLLSLPNDVLSRCLEALSLEERHRALPLTCRRLSRLVNSPQLLRAVEFDSTDDILSAKRKQPSLAAAQSFDCWAVRHAAGAVQRLSLRIGSPTAQGSAEPDAIWSEMLGVLAACGAAGGLQEARLYVQFCSASLPAWLPVALRGVRLLHVVVEEGMLQVDVSLTAMTVLTDLHLEATAGDAGLYFETAALLPRALRRLHLAGTCWVSEPPEELPPQIPGLRALKHLSLETCSFTPEGLEPLSQLAHSLEALRMYFCDWLPAPATLARLTRLTYLDTDNFIGDREESMDDVPRMLEETLAALPQLRALRVSFNGSGYYMSIPSFPRAATALQRLQHLVWDVTVRQDGALPPGGWLTGLLSLALPGDLIHHNSATLASAQRLQHLAALQPRDRDILECAPGYASWHPATVRWAASQPGLRRLDIEEPSERAWKPPALGPDFDHINAETMQQNPALQICTESGLAALHLEQFLQRVGCLTG